jgi:co-chaperonin GroES (HSP10)
MPVTLMRHEIDPRDALLAKIGPVDDVELFHNQVLVAVYFRPEKTSSGLYLTDATKDEDRHQSKIGLVIKKGSSAFRNDDKWSWPDVEVGDWVFYRVSDGWSVTVNNDKERLCRVLDDVDIKGRVQHPDMVW